MFSESCLRKLKFMSNMKVSSRRLRSFLTLADKLDELNTTLNKYFVHLSENQIVSHVLIQVPCVDLGADKDACK